MCYWGTWLFGFYFNFNFYVNARPWKTRNILLLLMYIRNILSSPWNVASDIYDLLSYFQLSRLLSTIFFFYPGYSKRAMTIFRQANRQFSWTLCLEQSKHFLSWGWGKKNQTICSEWTFKFNHWWIHSSFWKHAFRWS